MRHLEHWWWNMVVAASWTGRWVWFIGTFSSIHLAAKRHYFTYCLILNWHIFQFRFFIKTSMCVCVCSPTDTNECELLSSVCGEAECLNVDGSFLCVCPKGLDYNSMIAKCEPTQTGNPHWHPQLSASFIPKTGRISLAWNFKQHLIKITWSMKISPDPVTKDKLWIFFFFTFYNSFSFLLSVYSANWKWAKNAFSWLILFIFFYTMSCSSQQTLS